MHEILPDSGKPGPEYRDKRVLITGGLGFIGSNLAVRLAEAGAEVSILDASVPGCGANPFNIAPIKSRVKVLASSIDNPDVLEAELRGTEVVFNLAGEISHSRSMEHPERDLHLNTLAQLRFLLACREHCPHARIVYASTRQIYGQAEYLPVDEEHAIKPIDFNGIHKHAATQYHLLLTRRGDLDCVVFHLSNVYGPRMALNAPHQGFLGVYLRLAIEGQPIIVYGDGHQLRDPVHVDDVADAFLRAGAASGLRSRAFNIGGPQALSLSEIAAVVARLGGKSDVVRVPYPEPLRRMDVGSYCSDASLAARELEWTPLVPFENGICSTLAYYFEHRKQYVEPINEPVQKRVCDAEPRRTPPT